MVKKKADCWVRFFLEILLFGNTTPLQNHHLPIYNFGADITVTFLEAILPSGYTKQSSSVDADAKIGFPVASVNIFLL